MSEDRAVQALMTAMDRQIGELIKENSELKIEVDRARDLCGQAADEIEVLTAERDQALLERDTAEARVEELEEERNCSICNEVDPNA